MLMGMVKLKEMDKKMLLGERSKEMMEGREFGEKKIRGNGEIRVGEELMVKKIS
jgi:hypothetical protein